MMQNSTIGSLLLSSGIMQVSQNELIQRPTADDDTFKSILDQQIRDMGRAKRPVDTPLKRSDIHQRKTDNNNSLKEPVKVRPNIDSTNSIKKEEPAAVAVDDKVNRASNENDTGNEEKKKVQNRLESILIMLDELIAKLSLNSGSIELNPDNSITMETGQVSLQDILKALVEGNTRQLEELTAKMDESHPLYNFKEIALTLQKLFDEVPEAREILNPENIEIEVEKAGSNQLELLNMLKAKCSEAITRLREQAPGSDSGQLMEPVADSEELLKTDVEDEIPRKEQVKKTQATVREEKNTQVANAGEKVGLEKPGIMENNSTETFNMPYQQKTQQTVGISGSEKPFILSDKPLAQTVTNQVVMKVKLMAGENKQEMEMNLKPESLGKLSLKIIHQQGEVLAKITAESEQVKGILESNMQLLKDSLEKSGLTVQDISVSVGNGNEGNEPQQDNNNGNFTRPRTLNLNRSEFSQHETLYEPINLSRHYIDQNSQIDLTA